MAGPALEKWGRVSNPPLSLGAIAVSESIGSGRQLVSGQLNEYGPFRYGKTSNDHYQENQEMEKSDRDKELNY